MAQKPSRIVSIGLLSGILYYVLDTTLHVKDMVFELLGRDASLTNRTELWEVVKAQEVNSIIGGGLHEFLDRCQDG